MQRSKNKKTYMPSPSSKFCSIFINTAVTFGYMLRLVDYGLSLVNSKFAVALGYPSFSLFPVVQMFE